jgi:hypothetical protein
MSLLDQLAEAALAREALKVRSLAQELMRVPDRLAQLSPPASAEPQVLAVAAALVDLLALRAGQTPPEWVDTAPTLTEPFFLLEAASRMPGLRALCLAETPEPLRRRGFYAPATYLEAA